MTASGLPSGTVTFLFTDIEGSTVLWEKYPEAMKTCLAKHDAILRSAIESTGGHIIKNTGDGLHAVFEGGTGGIAATLKAQQDLDAEAWEEIEPDKLKVRMGLHTGEAEQRAGDYYGGVLNRTARLMSVASGGQVLLSNATVELFREQLPPQAGLRDLGEHRLKDLVRPEHVYQLTYPGLTGDFPPIRSLDSFPNNLPIQLTSFIGRESELAEAKHRLASTRLLTLVGSGGTGKTRLSLQLAAEVLTDFSDGVWFVELAPLADPALILQAIAPVLGVHEQMGASLTEVILNFLRAKQMLLIFDNCEHLIEACARVSDQFLRASLGLKITASSREAMGINGETVYRVPSLALPDPGKVERAQVAKVEAVQLFLERAAAANPKFVLTEKNATAVVQICRRLDGIPLALELAAARVPALSAEQIAARLDDRFKLLIAGNRMALPRQQTLGAMIDWSYEMLGEAERSLLRQLSVFSGGWTLEAAEAVCSDLDVLNLLALLINKSLVVMDEDGGGTRYRLLETIRQYGLDKLSEAGGTERSRALHLHYFVEFAELGGTQMDTREVLEWLPRLQAEYDNFRAAMDWALEHEVEAALRLVDSLSGFWFLRGQTIEGINWVNEVLARAERFSYSQAESTHPQKLILAKAWQALSRLAFTNDNSLALKGSIACSALARQLGDIPMLVMSLTIEGTTRILLNDNEGASGAIEEAMKLARASGGNYELSWALGAMSEYYSMVKRDFNAARAYEEEGLILLEGSETSWAAVHAFFTSARAAMLRGEYAAAQARFLKSLPAFEQVGDQHRVNMIGSELAHIDRYEGRYHQAEAAYRKTIRVWQRLGHRAAIAHQLESFGFVARALGQPERAARLFAAAEALREKIGTPMNPQERIEYDAEVAGTRAQINENAFALAWAEGRNLTMERAISYAVGETQETG